MRHLFTGGDLATHLQNRRAAVERYVRDVPEETLRVAQESVISDAAAAGEVTEVTLSTDQATAGPVSEQSRLAKEFGEVVRAPYWSLTLTVPYRGDQVAIVAAASERQISGTPTGDVEAARLKLLVSVDQNTAAAFNAEGDRVLAQTERLIGFANNDIREHNQSLPGYARTLVEQRVAQIAESADVLSGLKFPPTPPDDRGIRPWS